MADNSYSDSASGGPIVISDESDGTASVDTRYSQRRTTQKVFEDGTSHPLEGDAVMGIGAASSSSGALIPSTFAVSESAQPQTHAGALVPGMTHFGMGQGVTAQPFGAMPNGISDMITTTNLVGKSVTGLPGHASTVLYPQTMSSPVTELQGEPRTNHQEDA